MPTAVLRKFAARFRPASNPPKNDNKIPEFERVDHTYTEDDRSTTDGVDFGFRPQVPSGFNIYGFKACNQFWDLEENQWTEQLEYRPPVPAVASPPVSNRVIAYNRKNNLSPHRNHIWIEIRHKPLFELMRPFFQGFSGFTGVVPGIDARHIYMQRKALRELIPQPAELQALPTTDRTLYADLQQLLDHIEEKFEEATLELECLKQEADPQIKWGLLWALVRPGELIETQSVYGLEMAFRPKTWAYISNDASLAPSVHRYREPTYEYDTGSQSPIYFEVRGEAIEWTGRQYAITEVVRSVRKYSGTRSINALDFKPLASAKKSSLTERGKRYIKLTDACYLNYNSFAMWRENRPEPPVEDRYGRRRRFTDNDESIRKEPADGRVMIDILSYRRFNPGADIWSPNDFPNNSSQENLDSLEPESITMDENSPNLCLLPPTVHGWSFVLKRWGEFSVNGLSPISFEPNAFDHVVLPEDDKELIKALVEGQANSKEVPLFEDVIPGKGRGLVMLFHGNTGTGKTLTAEAISEHLQLPLYAVSAQELNIGGVRYAGGGEMETDLKRILEISSLWKAVVLIDEADGFLRERDDDWGSSTVEALLRVLEYHSGIMILTTNYVRNIDKAIRSRLNLAVRYHDLDFESRKILWEKFLERAGAKVEAPDSPGSPYDLSQEDVKKLSERTTNGRAIKHSVQAALALARSSRKPLSIHHIQKVWRVQDAFDAELPPTSDSKQGGSSTDDRRYVSRRRSWRYA